MLASYVLSRTLVPTMAKYLLKAHEPHGHGGRAAQSVRRACSGRSTRGFEPPARRLSRRRSSAASRRRGLFAAGVPAGAASPRSRCCRGSGRTSSRRSTAASSSCTCARRPARASRRRRALCDQVDDVDPRRDSRRARSSSIIDNIGLPYSGINLSYSNSAPIGAGGRRHPGRADRRITGRPRTTCASCAIELARRVSRRAVLLPAGRHRQPDPELRPARADRRADRRPRTRTPTARFAAALLPKLTQVPGHRRPARAAGGRTSRRSTVDVDRTRAAQVGLHAARRRQQPARLAQRQRPDGADLLAQPGERRQLQRRDADAAVPDGLARRTCRRSRSAAAPSGAHRRCSRTLATMHREAGHGGRVALQRAAGHRHLRRGRRGATSAASRDDMQPIIDAAQQGPAARLADRRARPGRDDADARSAACASAWCSRSCSSTC